MIEEGDPEKAVASPPPKRRWGLWVLFGSTALVVLLFGGFTAAAFELSGATLKSDPSALASLDTAALGGTVEGVHATGPDGKVIPVAIHNGRVVPKRKLEPGEKVRVAVVVKRPSVVGLFTGSEDHEHLVVTVPNPKLRSRWLTVKKGAGPRVTFSRGVRTVAFGPPGDLRQRTFAEPQRSLALGSDAATGSFVVAAASVPWTRLSRPQTVTWFPAGGSASMVASPTAGSDVSPSTPLHLVFSKPVSAVLGSGKPKFDPDVEGSWSRPDPHTLVFTPSGFGAPFDSKLKLELPEKVSVVQDDGSTDETNEVDWTVPAGSTLRLQQLLAQAGYLPVDWKPSGTPVARTPEAEAQASVNAPDGHFSWRYADTPASLKSVWSVGRPNVVTQGAVMTFEDDHGMATDGVAGPDVFEALMKDAIAGKRKPDSGYSYVHVTESIPETVVVWHNGKDVVTGPANTGIPGADTALGTFPVFEHLTETTMSGENPDGSQYVDPGIKWVSYFNGGDALHAFDRASYGTPQSLGCVEMPEDQAGQVFPYTPIGTLVTILP